MNYERLKALAFKLSQLSAEIIAEFQENDRTLAEIIEEQKKIPIATSFRSLARNTTVN